MILYISPISKLRILFYAQEPRTFTELRDFIKVRNNTLTDHLRDLRLKRLLKKINSYQYKTTKKGLVDLEETINVLMKELEKLK